MTAADRKRQQEHIRHWRESAERNWRSATTMFRDGHYDWSLFVAHLAIEKLLKSLVARAELTPPFTHDLERLATVAKLTVPAALKSWLGEISTFNVEARYEAEKLEFYKKATKAYATTWLERTAKVYQWLSEQ